MATPSSMPLSKARKRRSNAPPSEKPAAGPRLSPPSPPGTRSAREPTGRSRAAAARPFATTGCGRRWGRRRGRRGGRGSGRARRVAGAGAAAGAPAGALGGGACSACAHNEARSAAASIEGSLVPRAAGEKVQAHATTTRSWPASTAAPSAQRTSATRPARGAASSFSIFIASSTTSVCPAVTASPALTSSLIRRPGIGERSVMGAPPAAGRPGGGDRGAPRVAHLGGDHQRVASGPSDLDDQLAVPAVDLRDGLLASPPQDPDARLRLPSRSTSTAARRRRYAPSASSSSTIRSLPSILTASRRITTP